MTESNRNSLMQTGDAIRRSLTRNSHYSHTSTQSWVMSNQQNPPPPPPEGPEPLTSPVRASRPLPDPIQPSPAWTARPLPEPQLQAQHHPQLHSTNADPPDDDEEYTNIDPNFPGLQTGYLSEGMGRGRRVPIVESPTAVGVDVIPPREHAGFVGGFVNNLRRLPRVMLKYRSFGDKRKYIRKATYGSGATLTNATDMTTGNTLPLYASNPPTPVAGPSNTRYVEAIQMPVPHPAEPSSEPSSDILGPSLSQRRHPSFRVTPPSDEAPEQQPSIPLSIANDHEPVVPSVPPTAGSPRISNAVTIFNIPGHEEYPMEEPNLPLPDATANRSSSLSASQHPHRVSSAAPSIPADHDVPHVQDPASPVLVHPSPAADYRKMTLSSRSARSATLSTGPSFSSQLHPVRSFFVKLYRLPWIAPERVTADYSPGIRGHGRRRRTSSGVKKPMTSWYRGKPGVVLSVKNGNGDGNGNDQIDLLSSNGGGSRRTSVMATSPRRASPALRVRRGSPGEHQGRGNGDRQGQGHGHGHRSQYHHHHQQRRHRRTRDRNTISSTMTDFQAPLVIGPPPTSTGSPLIPAVYPYPYAFPVPYQAFSAPTLPPPPPPPIQPQRTQSGSHTYSQGTPRGPRPHRSTTTTATATSGATATPTYPTYQPTTGVSTQMHHTPPPVTHQVFLMHSPAQTAHSLGDVAASMSMGVPGQKMMSSVYAVPMSLIPGAFPQGYASSVAGTPSPPPQAAAAASSSAPVLDI